MSLTKEELAIVDLQALDAASTYIDPLIESGHVPLDMRDWAIAIFSAGIAYGTEYMRRISIGETPWMPQDPIK